MGRRANLNVGRKKPDFEAAGFAVHLEERGLVNLADPNWALADPARGDTARRGAHHVNVAPRVLPPPSVRLRGQNDACETRCTC